MTVIMLILAVLVTGEFNKNSMAKMMQIADASKVASNYKWTPTGRWYVDSVGTVMGQVSLGACVFNVHGPTTRPRELQVTLSSSGNANVRDFWTFMIVQLHADDVKARADDYDTTRCFYPSQKTNS